MAPISETGHSTSHTATYAFRAHRGTQRSQLLTTASDSKRDLRSRLLPCRMGRRGAMYRTKRNSGNCLRRVCHLCIPLHYSTTSCEIKGSPGRFCTRAPAPRHQTSFWDGIVATRSVVLCVFVTKLYLMIAQRCADDV